VSGVGEVDAASSALHWYDFVCPFCYLGQARTAIKLFEAHFALGEDIDNQAVIDRHATNAGVDLGALHTALADGSAYAEVDRAEKVGRQYGVDGTPAWLLGGRLIVGLQPASEFQRVGQDALRQRA
jgi:predicted DsbA family dithiol-disulfide isomerase